MPGKRPSLDTLETRRCLLVAEAEVQREQLRREVEVIRSGVRALGEQAKSVGSIASTVALIIAGLSAFRGARGVLRVGGKLSMLSRIIQGARLASTVWLAYRSRKR